jgi:exopolyphosphatase / guanosine-5'-triphosphate,3'-diphosphate pyrophosphatase
MEKIVPRWEWRTFGQDFGEAEKRFAALATEKVQKSEEIYLVAAGSESNVKVRDQLLDIKIREHVDANGLEQWRPVMKSPFPLSAAAISSVKSALGLPAVATDRDNLSLEQLLEWFALPSSPIRIVNVSKVRARYHVGGCVSELTEVLANGKKVRTVAIEDADAAKVIAAVRAMGLDHFPNTSYPSGLKQVIGLANTGTSAPRQAVIDVGTNSVKFHVGERKPDGTWTTVVDRADVTRLGEGLEQTGSISPEAMERTAAAIAKMKDEATQTGVDGITAVGTMGLRTASNRDAFLELVRQRCGIAIEVISGSEEARIAYLGVRSGLGTVKGTMVIFDTGGGSSQFTFGDGEKVDRQFSVNVGAVRFTERFGLDQPVLPEALKQAMDAIAADLSKLDDAEAPDALVGMGGAVTNIAAVKHALSKYNPKIIQGSVIERADVDRQIEAYRCLSTEARRQVVGLQPKRAEVILAGACIVRTIMEKLKSPSLSVSDRGLRHGLLIDRFSSGH